ncbi:MAG: hypothetical protein CL930_13910 [Deltaproteobacteria bacterium]|nr:hypothetical protein [Deltaproteobacteria bacterium]
MVLQKGKRMLVGIFFLKKKCFGKNTNTQKQLFFVFALVVQVRSRVHLLREHRSRRSTRSTAGDDVRRVDFVAGQVVDDVWIFRI